MAINPNLVGVPAQSKNLDTTTTTTTAGLVHRQVISLADPETATNYARVSGGSLQVSVQNATLAVTQSGTFNITNISGTVSLPTGASTATLQTTGNTSLNSIDTKTPTLSGGRVPVESNLVQGLTDTQLRASAVPVSGTFWQATQPVSAVSLPLPTDASTSALQTTGNSSLSSIDAKTPSLSSGRVPVESNLVQGLTDTQLRASAVPVSAASLPLPTGAATSAAQTDGTQKTQLKDKRNLIGFGASFSPLNELLQHSPLRLVGQGFTGTTLDTVAWSTSASGSGAVTLTGDSTATLTTGATANSSINLSSTRAARFMFGYANMFRAVVSTGDAGTANNVRSIGVDNGTDGLGFTWNGTAFGIYYKNNSVVTNITSGFNGDLGTTYTWSTTPRALEIVYFTTGFWFFVDDQLLHTIALSTLSAPLTQSLSLPLAASNTNSGGSTTNLTLKIWNQTVFRLGNEYQRPKYANITTNTTTTLKLGAGTLRKIIINTNGSTNNTATIYDNTTGSGTKIGTITTSTAVGGTFEYDLDFFAGLTIVTANGSAANLTVVYD